MPRIAKKITYTEAERKELEAIVRLRNTHSWLYRRARIVLQCFDDL